MEAELYRCFDITPHKMHHFPVKYIGKGCFFLILPNPCSDFSDTKFEFHTEGLVKQKRWNALDGQKRLFLVVFEPFQVPSNAGLAPFSLQKKGSKNGQCGVKKHTSWPISTVF